MWAVNKVGRVHGSGASTLKGPSPYFQSRLQFSASHPIAASALSVAMKPVTGIPEEGSLYYLIRQHNGRLFVKPLHWTDLHSQLLAVQFNDKISDSGLVEQEKISKYWEALVSNLNDLLDCEFAISNKPRLMASVMSSLFSLDPIVIDLSLHFGTYKEQVQAQCIFRQDGLQNTLVAYTNMREITKTRKLFPTGLIPNNPDHDPYIVSVLIASAQAHFYQEKTRLVFRDVKVSVITHSEHSRVNGSDAFFTVYTATVKAAFLELFAYPAKCPNSRDRGLQITYSKVKVWPALGLKERLGNAIWGNSSYPGRKRPFTEGCGGRDKKKRL